MLPFHIEADIFTDLLNSDPGVQIFFQNRESFSLEQEVAKVVIKNFGLNAILVLFQNSEEFSFTILKYYVITGTRSRRCE